MSKRPSLELKRVLAAVIAAGAPFAAHAASGEFTFVVGEVSLQKANGQRVTPARGTAVDPGDRITTGANGMAQLTMVDQARLSLRPSTQFVIEAYPANRESDQGGILNLVKGTLRTFTGLLSANNRERYVMKTRVATVGIRGSGNILYACEQNECDPSVTGEAKGEGFVTVNHTIEGSHAISNLPTGAAPGTPAQQGGTSTLITGPGQTVLVAGFQPPRYIPTPRFISDAAISVAGAKPVEAAAPGSTAAETRNYAPGDSRGLPSAQQTNVPLVGNNGLGFPVIDASDAVFLDPQNLRDIVITVGSPFYSQATGASVVRDGTALRSYVVYNSGVEPAIVGGTLVESTAVTLNGALITLGRYSNPEIGFSGPNSAQPFPGSIAWINSPAGYPTYLSDVLTGAATYTLSAATTPANQNNVTGSLGSMSMGVDFTNRILDFHASVAMPASGSTAGGSWTLDATSVPFALNQFAASTQDRLHITSGAGQDSEHTGRLSGSVQGSFVGAGIGAAVVGYGISDTTDANPAHWQIVSGVAALNGQPQDGAAPYREGRISDPRGTISGEIIQTYATTNRPNEVTSDTTGAVTSFSGPYRPFGSRATYNIGSSQVVDQGVDLETGLVWGRWAGGQATVTSGSNTAQLFLQSNSLHYIFANSQSGPVALPLSGTGIYDVIGSTHPTDNAGHVGTLNTATLNANFSNKTVDAAVNIAINGQTWTGTANGMPIYRDQYFGAFSGTPIPGAPNNSPLIVNCTPGCGSGASGSFDGFFTGRTGQRAGLMYSLGGNQGGVVFGRRGGGG